MTISEPMQNHVVVAGYSDVGHWICVMLEMANIPYIGFEVDLERLAAARKRRHNVHYGDLTEPSMMSAVAIAHARALILTNGAYSTVKQLTATLKQFYPGVRVITAVQFLRQRDELRRMGGAHVLALAPQGLMSFGQSVLHSLGVDPERTAAIIRSLEFDDYVRLRAMSAGRPEDLTQEHAAESVV